MPLTWKVTAYVVPTVPPMGNVVAPTKWEGVTPWTAADHDTRTCVNRRDAASDVVATLVGQRAHATARVAAIQAGTARDVAAERCRWTATDADADARVCLVRFRNYGRVHLAAGGDPDRAASPGAADGARITIGCELAAACCEHHAKSERNMSNTTHLDLPIQHPTTTSELLDHHIGNREMD